MLADYLFTSLTMFIGITHEIDVYCAHIIVVECFVLHNINLLCILRNIYSKQTTYKIKLHSMLQYMNMVLDLVVASTD